MDFRQLSQEHRAIISLADDFLVQGHILTAVSGWGPELEINIALSSMGQDNLGHARLLYSVVVGTSREEINSAIYERADAHQYLARGLSWLYSQEWEILLAKHLLANRLLEVASRSLGALGMAELSEHLERIEVERSFHKDFWNTWTAQTLGGSSEARDRVQRSVAAVWPLAQQFLFDVDSDADNLESEEVALRRAVEAFGILGGPSSETMFSVDDDRNQVLDELRYVYTQAPGRW